MGKRYQELSVVSNNPENFSFALFGDNKDGSALFDALLHDIDQRKEVSFAVSTGDFVAAGRRKELRSFIGELQDTLNIPLITVIGNHDLHQGSSTKYREVFGNT
jgi:predicted phosphodiesterase